MPAWSFSIWYDKYSFLIALPFLLIFTINFFFVVTIFLLTGVASYTLPQCPSPSFLPTLKRRGYLPKIFPNIFLKSKLWFIIRTSTTKQSFLCLMNYTGNIDLQILLLSNFYFTLITHTYSIRKYKLFRLNNFLLT